MLWQTGRPACFGSSGILHWALVGATPADPSCCRLALSSGRHFDGLALGLALASLRWARNRRASLFGGLALGTCLGRTWSRPPPAPCGLGCFPRLSALHRLLTRCRLGRSRLPRRRTEGCWPSAVRLA